MYRRVPPVPAIVPILLGLVFSMAALAQSTAENTRKEPGKAWSAIADLPNFVGVWEVTFNRGGARPAPISLTPKYAAMQKAYQSNPPQDTPAANCVPPGMPEIMGQPYPIEFLFTPGKVTILIEAYMQIRHIYTDGRKHPDDPDLTYNGNSIGHWEGDTLVVDSVGFTPDTPLAAAGMRHSSKMHIVERMHLLDANKLEIATTVDDAEALANPFTRTATFARHSDWTMAEYICQQNNRNFVDEKGKAGINLSR
jgi:hypothetical protein